MGHSREGRGRDSPLRHGRRQRRRRRPAAARRRPHARLARARGGALGGAPGGRPEGRRPPRQQPRQPRSARGGARRRRGRPAAARRRPPARPARARGGAAGGAPGGAQRGASPAAGQPCAPRGGRRRSDGRRGRDRWLHVPRVAPAADSARIVVPHAVRIAGAGRRRWTLRSIWTIWPRSGSAVIGYNGPLHLCGNFDIRL